jgi:hypothetical protein
MGHPRIDRWHQSIEPVEQLSLTCVALFFSFAETTLAIEHGLGAAPLYDRRECLERGLAGK